MVRLLVEAGANLERKDEQNGWTPLIAAVAIGQFDVVKFLLEAGADINNTERDSHTALMLAVKRNTSPKHPGSRLFPENSFKYIEILTLLLEAGADVNAKTDEGWTALMSAANLGNSKAVELL
ncbi:MAG TPA: hypothetical protein DCE56_28875, partial [Cyanobacteria bacterium UBA8553]|nr:hypothetical protein [Cyanobacteria bacterium UBA8553]